LALLAESTVAAVNAALARRKTEVDHLKVLTDHYNYKMP